MKYLLLFGLTIIFNQVTFSQEGNHWRFGSRAGLDFNFSSPVPTSDSEMITAEGCSAISDSNGDLLMYTDGETIWNRNHDTLLNGANLDGNSSSTQSSIFVPKPGSSDIYYLFTTDGRETGDKGFKYSEIDMTLDGSLGGVTTIKNELLVQPALEKLSGVISASGDSIWMVGHGVSSNTFHAYLVTSSGVSSTAVMSSVGTFIPPGTTQIGQMKISPDGSRLVMANTLTNVELFDFDAKTGEVSNPLVLNFNGGYGIEFSPSSELVYVANGVDIVQYDLTATNIPGSEENIATLSLSGLLAAFGSMQLAPDGKIYIAVADITPNGFLSVINNPNERGSGSNFVEEGISLASGTGSFSSLPQFLPSLISNFSADFSVTNLCSSIPTSFTNNTIVFDSLLWDFGDPSSGNLDTSTLNNPTHIYNNDGSYTVTLIAYNGGQADTASQLITIQPIDDASFNYSSELYCISDLDPIPTVVGLLGGIFSSDSLVLDTNTGQINIVGSGVGNYEITYTTNGACPNASTLAIQIDSCIETTLIVPNVFSPNGDGQNEEFRVSITGNNLKEIQIQIYNRWGRLLYETNQMGSGWDGFTSAGVEASEGTYFYTINTVNSDDKKETLQGTFTLLR